ncbi:MAG TPA: TonB-dependent receptor [Steroidobacteraceae bacterium]|nr:TonB-dependent receptor [Steroidobacteraceae bacterium]
MKSILSAVIGATLALTAIEATAQATPGERQVSLTIETDTLASALDKWAQQSGFQIFVQDWEATKKLPARSLKGTFTAQDALEQLLSGTSLTYTWISDKAVSIRRKTPQTVPTALQRTSLEGDHQGVPVAKFSDDVGNRPGAASFESAASEISRDRPNSLEVEEVLVTGTHIRGVTNTGSKVTVVDRSYFEKSGYSTVQDVLKTLPQNFGGGESEDFTVNTNAANFNSGSSINLRGLGADATLVLVDGQRQAPGGIGGAFIDVSNIPVAAIERIEILSDGASAIYGSDAVGGVVNIVLRHEFDGAETRLRVGSYGGDASETQASQLVGTSWSGGSLLLGYQFLKREALQRKDRAYAASSDQTRNGGSDFRSPFSNPGNIFDPLTFAPGFGIPQAQDGTQLTPADLSTQTNAQDNARLLDLLPEQKMHSAFVEARQTVGDRVNVRAAARYNRRSVESLPAVLGTPLFVTPENPFFVEPYGFPFAVVGYSFVDDLGPLRATGDTRTTSALVGATVDMASSWQMAVSASRTEEKTEFKSENQVNFPALTAALADPDPTTAFNPFGDGSHTAPATIEAIRGTERDRATATTTLAQLKADGSVFDVHGVAAKLAVGLEYRAEKLNSENLYADLGFPDQIRNLTRNVSAAFSELAIPLLSRSNGQGDVGAVWASLAGRFEHYDDFGDTFNPKLGLSWSPSDSFALRGTWGTSFKAPRLIELNEAGSRSASLQPVVDPTSPAGTSVALVLFGNNAELKEERATTWTMGFDITPTSIPITLSLTYFDIDYKDRIAAGGPPSDPLSILLQESQWSEVINRNPSQAQIDEICNSPAFFGSPIDCATLPPSAIIDLRLRNLGVVRTRGVDLVIKDALETDHGTFNFELDGTYVLDIEQAVTSRAPRLDILDTLNNPLSLRLRGSASYSLGNLSAGLQVNYADSYKDTLSQPARRVNSWTTLDGWLSYRTGAGAGLLENCEASLTLVNLLDKDPPFADRELGYDAANADPYGRVISLQVQKDW